MTHKRKFTILHGLAVSIAIHAVLGLPLLASVVRPAPPEEPPLFIELQGVAPDSPDLAEVKPSDVDQKHAEPQLPRPDTPEPAKDTPRQQPTPPPPSEEPPMEVADADDALRNPSQPAPPPLSPAVETPPPAAEKQAAPDDSTVNGAKEYVPPSRQFAQVEITDQEYSALLMKKVRDNLVYPDQARRARLQGVATVSFVILSNGDIRPETLKVVRSSGQPALDGGALNTIRASAPFAPPPREMAVSIGVAFGPKR
jgi:periplasmic protein TonB